MGDSLVTQLPLDQSQIARAAEEMIAESPVPTKPFRMPRGLITVLKWGGSILALVLALTGLLVEIIVPGHGTLGALFWLFAMLGIAAAIAGVILDRPSESSDS